MVRLIVKHIYNNFVYLSVSHHFPSGEEKFSNKLSVEDCEARAAETYEPMGQLEGRSSNGKVKLVNSCFQRKNFNNLSQSKFIFP